MGCSTWSSQIFFLQLLLLYFQCSAKLCSHDQSSALLQFKQLFSFDQYSSFYCDGSQQSYRKMKSWKKDTDCCSWDGVTCDMVTGHVIGLDLSCSWLQGNIPSNSSLFILSHLRKLNLAFNDFNNSNISSGFSKFPSLKRLNLSNSNFHGQLPSEMSHLSQLVSLDLSSNELRLQTSVWNELVQNLTNLKQLILDKVDMFNVVPGSLTNLSSSLSFLSLADCGLRGKFPESIFCLQNLETISLTNNGKLSGVFPMVNLSSSLRFLDLSYCNFIGSIPTAFGNLTQLTHLDLKNNKFSGHIPSSLSNLGLLAHFDLSAGNNFTGEIPDIFSNLTQLSHLDLSSNQLIGPIPLSMSRRRNSLPSLKYLDLCYNLLSGSIPSSMSELVKLTHLGLCSNNFSGNVELYMFAKLKNLTWLDVSQNKLSLSSTFETNSSFPNLHWLSLSGCNINQFPDILRTQRQLQGLSLSENKIHGNIPNWMWDMAKDTLFYLNLSHNFLQGIHQLPWDYLTHVDLRSNLLQGSLMALPPSILFFSVSNNKLTGEIPSSFCDLGSIAFVDLSNNSLSGPIPQCLGNSTLTVLDLGMNNFGGIIPQTFAKDCSFSVLNLNGNHLQGTLPRSLVNCRSLEVLDVGNNNISDTFPHWLEHLPKLQALIIRSNQFNGAIGNSSTRFPFHKLRILDLSHNKFSGILPTRYFKAFAAMMDLDKNSTKVEYMKRDYDGYYSVSLTVKGIDIEMMKILTIFTTIDLSSNQFQGQIPEVVGKLNSLKVLNLSHNTLTGYIPSSLGNLKALESLDLSSNMLVGKIPWQLTNMNFLQVLNLSQNQLVGPIPRDNHFDTFSSDSFSRNLGLCGFQLSKKCKNDEAPEPTPTIFHGDDTSSWFDWKMAKMGYVSGLVIGLSMGYIVFGTGRPRWIVRMVERKQSKRVRRLNRRGKGRRN